MRTYLDCYSCFLRQALEAARMARLNEDEQLKVLQNIMEILHDLPPGRTPPEIGHVVHQTVKQMAGNSDPYRDVKERSTREALALYPKLKHRVAICAEPLETAVRLSIAGNIIDFGPFNQYTDLWTTVEHVLETPIQINHLENFRQQLDKAPWILFLADNAGETVFDRLLIETLSVPVTYAVKGSPILNDATEEDALAAGIHNCATIISNGASAPGTILSLCSDSFRQVYNTAPLIIAKGQANYETLSTAGANVFCFLQVKCPVIGRDLGVPVGSLVIRSSAITVDQLSL
jgi:uncharacterized protein with ATP-grasp and redox domains